MLVDTSIWSLALRRRARDLNPDEQRLRAEFAELIREGRVVMLGVIRQEALSGISTATRFEQVRTALRTFVDEPILPTDHERAAEHFNTCQSHGIQGSHIDYLICAVAERLAGSIFTTDGDFGRYAAHLPIRLHQVRPELT
ncbi:MAG: PIN domain-containing protein [Dehalococcoidia bacterium]